MTKKEKILEELRKKPKVTHDKNILAYGSNKHGSWIKFVDGTIIATSNNSTEIAWIENGEIEWRQMYR